MAKRAKQEPVFVSQRDLARQEREAKQRRYLIMAAVALAAVIVVILAAGLYDQYVLGPREPIAVVYDQPILTRDYQIRVKYTRFDAETRLAALQSELSKLDPTVEENEFLVQYLQQQVQAIQNEQVYLPTTVLGQMIDEELIRHECAARGITVSAEEVQREIELRFGWDRNPPTPAPTPTVGPGTPVPTPVPTATPMTEEQFNQRYQEYLLAIRQKIGIDEAAFRRSFESELLKQKLAKALGDEVPTSGPQVRVRHILLETEEAAQAALDRLNNGEKFEDLAKELSKDTASAESGGDVGWFASGDMVPQFEVAAFALEQPGQTSEIVKSDYGFHIIQLIERDEDREFSEASLQQMKAGALDEFLLDHAYGENVKRYYSEDKVPK